MKTDYKIITLKKAKTPPMLRAEVQEKHTANSLDIAVGRRSHTVIRHWVGWKIWHEAGEIGRVRATKQLETFLASKNHLINAVEEATECHIPALCISFGRKFA